MPPSSESGSGSDSEQSEESEKSHPTLIVAAADPSTEAAASTGGEPLSLQANPVDPPGVLDPTADATADEITAPDAALREATAAQAELPHEGPPIQWGRPTQPQRSRPSAPRPLAPVSQPFVPEAQPAPQAAQPFGQQSGHWPQQPPAFGWPQQLPPQYPQPQPVAPPQPAPYSTAYPQAQQMPPAVQLGQPYPGYPQLTQPAYPGPPPAYPQVYPPPPQTGAPTPGSWPYAQPAYAQAVYGHPTQTAVVESGRSGPAWQPEAKPRQSFIWRVVKWPIKTVLKGVYLTGSAAKRHRAAALVLLVLVAMLAGGAYAVYQSTHPAPAAAGPGSTSTSQPDNTPFTIVTGSQPPLSAGVITFLHGYKSFDGYQLWSSFSPSMQQNLQANGLSADQLNGELQQEKQAGIAYTEFIYTGGFLSPDGTSNFTVEAVMSLGSAHAVRTWYFMTDTSDKIVDFEQLSPNSQSGQGGQGG